MEGWIVFLLVVIVAVLILGRKQFGRIVGFVLAGSVALFIFLVFFRAIFDDEMQQEHSGPTQQHELPSNWRSLVAGMSESDVRGDAWRAPKNPIKHRFRDLVLQP